jgi:hypothetical protein
MSEPDHASKAAVKAAWIGLAGNILAGASAIIAACITVGLIAFSPARPPIIQPAPGPGLAPGADVFVIPKEDAIAVGVFVFGMFAVLLALAAREQIREWWYTGRF